MPARLWQSDAVPDEDLTAALVAEACQRSPLVWVRAPGRRPQPVWSTWHEAALVIVVDGEEQPSPVPDGAHVVEVAARSKTAQWRLVTFTANVEVLEPGTERWTAAAEALKTGRLNAHDPDTLLGRWAAASRILRLVPSGAVTEAPGRYDAGSGAAEPAPTSAVTVHRKPFHLGRRPRRHRG